MRWRGVLALLALLPLAGCASGNLTGEYHSVFYQPELVGYSARNGVMPTAVYGAPFDARGVDALLAELELPSGHPSARFAMTPAAQEGDLGRLVLVFDPGPAVADGADACRLEKTDTVPRRSNTGATRVLIAFCYGGGLAAEGTYAGTSPASPTDPALVAGLNTALLRILPSIDPNIDSSCSNGC